MGWSTNAPSGVSFGSAKESGSWSLSQGHALFTAAIARGAGNTIYIKVDFKRAAYDGYEYYGISMTAAVGGSSVTAEGAWGKYSAAYTTYATRYYTGTASANANVTVTVTLAGSSRSVSLKAPAYTSNTVTFNRNGGSGGTASVTATYGSAMPTITAPTRTGYTFTGYFTATSGGTKYYNANGTSAKTCDLKSNITLYAQWTANTYAVTLDAQSGSGGTGSVTATYGAAMPEIEPPTRAGYTFNGYFSGTNGSGTQYYTAAGASANKWATAAAATLYASWTANTYTVSFDSRGGTACESITVTYGSAYGTLPTSVLTNYTLLGWFTAAEGGTQVTAATIVAITADQTLYAHWTLNAVTITYYGNGTGAAGVPAPQDKIIGDTATISSAVPTRTGYTFLGWNTAPDGTGTAYSGGDTYSTDAPLDLYAQWAAIPVVSDLTAVRCDSSGVTTDTDADTWAVIGFDWAADPAVTGASYTILWVNREDPTNTGSVSGSLSGTSGTVSGVVCGAASGGTAAIETANQYDVTVTVTDSNGGAGTDSDFVSRAYYVMDFTAGGLGIGLGSPASDGRITTGLPHTADAEERGTHYETIINATDAVQLRTLDWDGNETLRGDLNAGGEVEDGSGNVLSEKADAANTYTKAEIDARIPADAHPVGSIYLSTESTSPASLFGGTWERITGKFLLAATDGGSSGASQAAGNTGGEAAHTLVESELPSISGNFDIVRAGNSTSNTTTVRATSGKFTVTRNASAATSISVAAQTPTVTSYKPDRVAFSFGSGGSHTNMPPYLAVYVWKRVS